MAVTVTEAWKQAFVRDGSHRRILATFYNGTTTWKIVSGSMFSTSDLVGTPVAITAVDNSSAEIDPLTRELSVEEITIDVLDAWIRPILVNNVLKGKKVTVYFGAAEIDEADFCFWSCGMIKSIEPQANGIVSVSITSSLDILQTPIVGYWMNKHPLEIMYDGAGGGLIEKAGVPAAVDRFRVF